MGADGEYYCDPAALMHPNPRKVMWLMTGVPRARFSQSARYEVGSAVTLFRVKNRAQEFRRFHQRRDPAAPGRRQRAAAARADRRGGRERQDEPNAERIETYTRDFLIETLLKEDGGFDIVAHRDPLGLEPPIIKVRCKRSVGAPGAEALIGTLAPNGQELWLFVTLGAYSKTRCISGARVRTCGWSTAPSSSGSSSRTTSSSVLEWKRVLPMRSIYVVDREPEA